MYVLRVLLDTLGDIQLGSITTEHFDHFREIRVRSTVKGADGKLRPMSSQNLNLDGQVIRGFVDFLIRRRVWSVTTPNPAAAWRLAKEPRHSYVFIPEDRFPEVINLAGASAAGPVHARRDRVRIALGLFSFGRDIELRLATWSQVRRVADGRLNLILNRPKVHRRDELPSFDLLAEELEDWRTFYQEHMDARGVRWSEDFPIIPKIIPYGHDLIDPDFKGRGELMIQPILEAMGYPTYKEGTHTLRRSGASAYHHWLTELGYGEPTRIVSSMLGHSDLATTEKYLDFDAARERMMKAVRASGDFGRGLSKPQPEPTRHLSVVRDVG